MAECSDKNKYGDIRKRKWSGTVTEDRLILFAVPVLFSE